LVENGFRHHRRTEEGVESTAREGHWRSYGVGIDTHSQFITVTVIIPDYVGGKEHQHRKSFPTDVPSLKCAKAWVQALLLPVQPTTAPLHYTLALLRNAKIAGFAGHSWPKLLRIANRPGVESHQIQTKEAKSDTRTFIS
jgi:hypothetical protein